MLIGLATLVGGCMPDEENKEEGPEVCPPALEEYFTIEVSNISSTSASVSVTASEEIPVDWLWDMDFATATVDADYVAEYLQTTWEWQLEELGATKEEYPLGSFIADFCSLRAGVTDEYRFEQVLEPDTEYVVWACGLDFEWNAVLIETYTFRTAGGAQTEPNDAMVGYREEPWCNITSSVDFTAIDALMFDYGDYYSFMPEYVNHQNYYIELYGSEVEVDGHFVALELLLPKTASSIVGTYNVGYTGDYIALSSLYLEGPTEEDSTYAGSCYSWLVDDTISDTYADLDGGTVTITSTGEDSYKVVVDARSSKYSIKATYTGVLYAYEPMYSCSKWSTCGRQLHRGVARRPRP